MNQVEDPRKENEQPEKTGVEVTIERGPDNYPCMCVSVGGNQLSLSIIPNGGIRWRHLVPTVPWMGGFERSSEFGKVLYALLDEGLGEGTYFVGHHETWNQE